jgi:hypothetical protein
LGAPRPPNPNSPINTRSNRLKQHSCPASSGNPINSATSSCARTAPTAGKDLLHEKANFASPFNAIPLVQSCCEKYSALPSPQIGRILAAIPPHEEGRIAIVTNVEAGSGGRETSQHAGMIRRDERNMRLRGDHAQPRHADERCFADGQAVWSWRPKAGAKFADRCFASRG